MFASALIRKLAVLSLLSLKRNFLNILEILDDFIYIVQAKSALEKLKPSGKDEFVFISPTEF